MSSNNVTYEVPTWSQIYEMLLTQAQKINRNFIPEIIVGIAWGGVIPARVLFDLLEIPQCAMIQIEFYVDIAKTAAQPTLKQPLTVDMAAKKVLLVDDIADSGKSLQLAKNHLKEQGAAQIKTATLYTKPTSNITPDFYEKQTGSWVVFPWEVKETLRKIIKKQDSKTALNLEIAKLVKAGLPKHLADRLLSDMQ